MEKLFMRGRAALAVRHAAIYSPDMQPMGSETLAIVTREDFVDNAGSCFVFATTERSLYILDDDGSIAALMCPQRGTS